MLLAINPALKSEIVVTQDMQQNFPNIDFLLCKCYVRFSIIFKAIIYIRLSISLENVYNFLEAFTSSEILHSYRVLIAGGYVRILF